MVSLTKRKHKVRVQFTGSDNAMEGILLGKSKGHYVLCAATAITPTQTSVLDGEVAIPKAQVLFYQRLSDTA